MAKYNKKKPLREAHPSTNPYDRKPIRNPLAGRDARTYTSNSGLVRGLNANPKSPYSFPTTRLGLVYRSLEDGVNLIENSGKLIKMINREMKVKENFFHNDEVEDEDQLADPPEEITV